MRSTREIYDYLDEFAPFGSAMSWDNSGLLVEVKGVPVTKVLVALDITNPVVEEAHERGAELILSHHPVIFHPFRRLTSEDPVYRLAKYDISAICAHTNLDLARGGVNDVLAKRLQLHNIQPLEEPESGSLLALGRIGELSVPTPLDIVLTFVKKNLGCRGVKYVPAGPDPVRRVAVCGGAGADLLHRAAALGADLLVTSDIAHDEMLSAQAAGISLMDAGHYCTEQVVLEPLMERLAQAFPDVEFMLCRSERDPAEYL